MQVWPLEAGLPRSLIWYRPRATANDDSPPDTFQCILRIGRTMAQNGEGSCGLTKVKLKKNNTRKSSYLMPERKQEGPSPSSLAIGRLEQESPWPGEELGMDC